MSIILHIDMNSYFASVEQQANPFLRGKPIGITGKQQERSIVAAASSEAKRLGVKTAMSTWEAKRICPSIILYPGDPEKYSYIQHRFNTIYHEYSNHVEEFSVDESFLDVTDTARDYLGAACMALSIRDRLKQELGSCITASIGIGPNRLIAKCSSERVKPNGLTVTPPKHVLQLLHQSQLQDLCGIGPRIERRLHNLGIFSFRDLRKFPLHLLVDEFKSYGFWLHEAAWGREISTRSSFHHAAQEHPKSYGHSYTLPQDTDDPKELQRYLLGMCDRVAWRLRRDQKQAKRISLSIRYQDFSSAGQQRLLKEPLWDGLTLYKIAWHLLDTWRDDTKKVRLIVISISSLLPSMDSSSLFKKDRQKKSLQYALDSLQTRYGQQIWTRASLINLRLQARSSGFHFDHEL